MMESAVQLQDLTEDQLEKLLAEKRLNREKQELVNDGEVNTVGASGIHAAQAVGSSLHVDIQIEGVPVTAMVDTGAQSTIISRSTLHDVNRRLKQQGQELPPLELPTVRLYGKDGNKGGKELVITAQVPLTLSLGDKAVSVPVFVQPDSVQTCLLGINAIPLLGISILPHDGKLALFYGPDALKVGPPLSSSNPHGKTALSYGPDAHKVGLPLSSSSPVEVATVDLVDSVALPAQKGHIWKAEPGCSDLLFEPSFDQFESLGVG